MQKHKDEIIELVKLQVKKYIEERKDEIIDMAEKKAIELIKEFML